MQNLQKYLKKTGRNFEKGESPDVLESAGQKKEKQKLKLEDKSGDELPTKPGDIARAVAGRAGKTGSVTKVKSDGGKAVEGQPSREFKSAGKKKY